MMLKRFFPSVIFKTKENGIHLTFDDAPHPISTPDTLNILRKRGIYATFFLSGKNVQKYPDLARQINSEGHQIANHAYTHANMFFKKKDEIRLELFQTEEILETTIGKHSIGFRPPYGCFNWTTLKVIDEFGLKCVLWDTDSKDWKSGEIKDIEHRLFRNISAGSILLFHNNDHTAKTLPIYLPVILDTILEKGFIFNKLPI